MQKEKTAEISMEIMTENPEDGPGTPPNSGVDASLHLLSPHLESIHLEVPQLSLTAASIGLRAKVQANQKHAKERSVRQYGKQRSVKTFHPMHKVGVAVPTLDRASTVDKRIFGRVLEVYEDTYVIQTKYGVLDRNCPTSELMELSNNISLDILDPPHTQKVTLHFVAAQESTVRKVSVHCGCKDKRTWCQTRRCACAKANTECFVACHGAGNKDCLSDCPNISSMEMRTQRDRWKFTPINGWSSP